MSRVLWRSSAPARRRIAASPLSFDAATISGLAHDWSASSLSLSDAAAVTSLPDTVSGGVALTQATTVRQATYRTNVANGKPAVRFVTGATAAEDDSLEATITSIAQPATWFVVHSTTAATQQQIIGGGQELLWETTAGLSIWTGAGLASIAGVAQPEPIGVTIFTVTGGVTRAWQNGGLTAATATTGTAATGTTLLLGRHSSNGRGLTGDIFRVGVYNRVLTDAEIDTLGNGLAVDYGLTWTSIIPAAAPGLNATFNTADDLNLFAYRGGTWNVTGGAAVATLTTAVAHDLRAGAFNLDNGGVLTAQLSAPAGAPTGFSMQFGANLGDNYSVFFDYDGFGLSARVTNWGSNAVTPYYIGTYSATTHAWMRITFGADKRPVFQVSSNGSTWNATHGVNYFPPVAAPWSHKALEVYWNVSTWQTIASTQASLLSMVATGPDIADLTHIDPIAATLLFNEDFAGTSLDTNRWSIDDSNGSLIEANNVTVSGSAMHMAISAGMGARVYWGGWMASPPPIARYGRYEFRMKLVQATNAGPAVMIWPEANGGDWAYGELDVYEGSAGEAHVNIHWSPTFDMVNNHLNHAEHEFGDFSQYNIWTWEWAPELMRCWITNPAGLRRLVYYAWDVGRTSAVIPNTDHDIRIHHRFQDGITPTGAEAGSLDIDYIKLYSISGVTVTR